MAREASAPMQVEFVQRKQGGREEAQVISPIVQWRRHTGYLVVVLVYWSRQFSGAAVYKHSAASLAFSAGL